jgi:hypothetical protein
MNRWIAFAVVAPLMAAAHPGRLVARAELHVAKPADLTDNMAEIASMYAQKHEWDRAVALYDEARGRRPKDLDILDDLITACMHSAPCAPRRLALLLEGVERLPQAAGVLEDLVRELVRVGRGRLAVPLLQRYARRHPDDLDAQALLIDTAAEMKAPQVALDELTVYLRHRPDDVEKRALQVELLQEGRPAAAEHALRSLERAHPGEVKVRALRARADLDRGDLHKAEAALAEIRTLVANERAVSEAACQQEEDEVCLGELRDDNGAATELAAEVEKVRGEQYQEFRHDVRFLDLADDLQREQDRDP